MQHAFRQDFSCAQVALAPQVIVDCFQAKIKFFRGCINTFRPSRTCSGPVPSPVLPQFVHEPNLLVQVLVCICRKSYINHHTHFCSRKEGDRVLSGYTNKEKSGVPEKGYLNHAGYGKVVDKVGDRRQNRGDRRKCGLAVISQYKDAETSMPGGWFPPPRGGGLGRGRFG